MRDRLPRRRSAGSASSRVSSAVRTMPGGIQYGSEREKGKGVILKRVPPRALMADIARGVGARGRLTGPVPVEDSALGDDRPAARCGKDRRERHTAMRRGVSHPVCLRRHTHAPARHRDAVAATPRIDDSRPVFSRHVGRRWLGHRVLSNYAPTLQRLSRSALFRIEQFL